MKVRELIEQLQKLPPNYDVYREGGEYQQDWRNVSQVTTKALSLGNPEGVFIS